LKKATKNKYPIQKTQSMPIMQIDRNHLFVSWYQTKVAQANCCLCLLTHISQSTLIHFRMGWF